MLVRQHNIIIKLDVTVKIDGALLAELSYSPHPGFDVRYPLARLPSRPPTAIHPTL